LSTRRDGRWPLSTYRLLMAVTCALQVYLYALNVVSNGSWGRNVTARLVAAFAPTVWSGREPFPVGPLGITLFACATVALTTTLGGRLTRASDGNPLDASAEPANPWRANRWRRFAAAAALAAGMAALFGATLTRGIANRDSLFWKQELAAS